MLLNAVFGKGKTMRRTSKTQELMMELLVGAFMFAALLGLAFFTIILSRENIFKKTYPLEVVFEDVMGLRDGDNVVIRGMTVGKVKALTLQADGVHVQAALLRPITLKSDYSIEIVASSVLGGRYMQIAEGTNGAPLALGAMIVGQKPYDLISLASAAVADLKDVSGKIKSGQGTLGKLIYDEELYDDARYILSDLRAAIDDRGLLDNLEGAVAHLNETAEKINVGSGTLGKLVNDDDLYDQILKTIVEVRAAVDDLRETSPIVTFSSIYFGAF